PLQRMWQQPRLQVIKDLFWPCLVRGLPHEMPPTSDDEDLEHLMSEAAPEWQLAERCLKRFETETAFREEVRAEVLLLLKRMNATRVAPGAAPILPEAEPTWLQEVVRWAVACNKRLTNALFPEPTAFQKDGRKRLLSWAVRHGRWLARYVQGRRWDSYLEGLTSLALGLREGVFMGKGGETARDLVLCLLAHAGFGTAPGGLAQPHLLEAIADGQNGRIFTLLQTSTVVPV